MLEIMYRKNKQGLWAPESHEDAEKDKEYPVGCVCEKKVTKASGKKTRSLQQLGAYFAGCRDVAANTENPDFNTAKKVDLQLRVKLGWIEDTIVVKGRVQFVPKSISYKEMKHLEACNYFSRAFEEMAKFLKCTVEEMLSTS